MSPLLANIYLHYVLDQWVQWWRRKYARGDVIIVRFADDVTAGFARGAMAEVFLALEVIDSRFHLDGITLADSVADNAACARFVLGEAVPMPSWDLRAERLTVCSGITPVAVGEGRDVLGDPIRSVVWLARHLAAFGAGLKAGDVVLAGAVHESIPVPAGETVSVSSPRLPPVSLHVA